MAKKSHKIFLILVGITVIDIVEIKISKRFISTEWTTTKARTRQITENVEIRRTDGISNIVNILENKNLIKTSK